jgi:hypothetical protein
MGENVPGPNGTFLRGLTRQKWLVELVIEEAPLNLEDEKRLEQDIFQEGALLWWLRL